MTPYCPFGTPAQVTIPDKADLTNLFSFTSNFVVIWRSQIFY